MVSLPLVFFLPYWPGTLLFLGKKDIHVSDSHFTPQNPVKQKTPGRLPKDTVKPEIWKKIHQK